ncbi:MAG: SGNH/GDSL hydrolase family protein [Clostridia bacterium]|nr:SGNH/GDSL hydrolase family protein [Clostridia bacterium]
MNLQGKTAAFLGDSITQGVYYTALDNGEYQWHQMNIKYCDVAGEILGLSIKNYGISGTCICPDTVQLPDRAFIKRYNEMDDADLVCVLGGTNDFGTDVKIGNPDDLCEDTFYGALNILCEGLVKKYSGKTVVFITPLYRVCGKNKNGNILADYRDAIVQIAGKKFGFNIIDGLSLGLEKNTENLKELLSDGLHPTPPAHEIIGKNLAEKLICL